MRMQDGYPFVLVMHEQGGSYYLSRGTYLYRFKSAKSHVTYLVRAEQFPEHAYCIKFYDKNHQHSDDKYSLLTNTFEVRTILYTIYHILLDVLHRDPHASFFFIGASDEHDELGQATRRFNVYRVFTASVVSENFFEHYRHNEMSLYILVNKDTVEDRAAYASLIKEKVQTAYMEADSPSGS